EINNQSVSVPVSGSKRLDFKVKAQNGGTFVYTLTINAYVAQTVTWTGSVVNSLTAGLDTATIVSVTSRDAAMQGRPATLASQGAISTTWSMTTGLDYTPKSFIVTLLANDNTYYVSEVLAAVVSSGTALQALNVTNAGIRISNPDELKTLENNANKNKDFALSSDIDLEESGTTWTGPGKDDGSDGYRGHFYGNGYTIKLVLSKTKGATALFNCLQTGATVENFVVDVSTKISPLNTTDGTYFGGVAGYLAYNANNITLNKITVKGNLSFGNSRKWLLIGGLVGEIKDVGTVNIINCVSALNVSVIGNNADNNTTGVGGLIGRIRRNDRDGTAAVTIEKCFTTGSITIQTDQSSSVLTKNYFAGGLVGDIGNSRAGTTTGVTINQCYSSSDVTITCSNTSSVYTGGAGGLVGMMWKEVGTTNITISNSAALGSRALLTANTSAAVSNNRVAGLGQDSGGNWSSKAPNQCSLNNNIARSGMAIGAPPGTPDTSSSDTNGTTVSGKAVTAEDLRGLTTWTTSLGWSENDWDFSGLSDGKLPILK
ncbi:MAG: hypothetical protein LBD22_02025, partial [Spirochaetaceae bacterium]|nr:hypothetical protein [Spirochaetaceae bacterium]